MSEPVETRNDATIPTEKHIRPEIPEGMSKSQWKKQLKRQRLIEMKPKFSEIRKKKKEKAKIARREKIQELVAKGEEIPHHLLSRKAKKPKDQKKFGSKFIIDCAFDDLMTENERTSLSSQITRAYSANRYAKINADVIVTSFNKLLKKRFEDSLQDSNYYHWSDVTFQEEEFKPEDTNKCIYLSADSDEVLNELEPDFTYIIGGIVDKGRYKNLCKEKAEKMGIKTARLPIGEYIKLSGRRVLTTTHVVELMLKWFEFKDWKVAFETVLPPRKLLKGGEADTEESSQNEGETNTQEEGEKVEAGDDDNVNTEDKE